VIMRGAMTRGERDGNDGKPITEATPKRLGHLQTTPLGRLRRLTSGGHRSLVCGQPM
jgi:hypothetical protein